MKASVSKKGLPAMVCCNFFEYTSHYQPPVSTFGTYDGVKSDAKMTL